MKGSKGSARSSARLIIGGLSESCEIFARATVVRFGKQVTLERLR
jgi:hypothetical protein